MGLLHAPASINLLTLNVNCHRSKLKRIGCYAVCSYSATSLLGVPSSHTSNDVNVVADDLDAGVGTCLDCFRGSGLGKTTDL